ncbi:uncharacterized [Tachysurus ichikawai]
MSAVLQVPFGPKTSALVSVSSRRFGNKRVLWDFTFAVTVYTQKYLTRLATACPDNFAAGRDVRCNGLRTSVHRTTDRQSHCTGGHRFHLVDSVVELEEGRMGGHVHVGHFVSLVGFWLPLEYEFLRSSPLSGLMGGVFENTRMTRDVMIELRVLVRETVPRAAQERELNPELVVVSRPQPRHIKEAGGWVHLGR